MLLVPFAGAYVVWLGATGAAVFATEGPGQVALFAGLGIITALPLLLFGGAATRVPMVVLGLLQYLAPTLQFACGVWAGEALTPLRVASFVFIWAGAGVFALAAFRRSRAARQAIRETAEPA